MLLFAGCGASETKFLVNGLPLLCEAAADCALTYDAASCEGDVRASLKGCDYDPRAARSCMRALKKGEGTCETDATLGTSTFAPPEDCDLVYADPCGSLIPTRVD